jgi:hypothetical protein
LAKRATTVRHDYNQVLAAILLAGWGTVDESSGERFVTNDEMRDVLIEASEDFRASALWQLDSWASHSDGVEWASKLGTFFSEVWPRHKKAKSELISARLCDLAFARVEPFPQVADAILPLLTKVEGQHLMVPRLAGTEENVIDKYPEKVLAILWAMLPDDASKWPYGADGWLGRIGVAGPELLKDVRLIELKRRWNSR